MPDNNLINYKLYSDEQNSSYLPYEPKCSFETVWEKRGLFIEDQLIPFNIALKDSFILLSYGSRIDLRKRENGDPVWNTQVLPLAAFDLKNHGFVAINNSGYYQLLNLEKKTTEELSLPFLSIQTKLYFSEGNSKQMSYCYQQIPTPVNSPGDRFEGPEFIFAKFKPQERKFVWQFIRKEIVKAVLRTTDEKRISVITENNIYSFDTGVASDEEVKKIVVGNILGASLDIEGNFIVYVLKEDGKYALRNLTAGGDIIWEYILEGMPSIQPPACHPEGSVYSIYGNTLDCIRNGKSIWSYRLPAAPGKTKITVLKDASVIACSDSVLLHISEGGMLLSQKIFDSPLTCRAVPDTEGNLFVATVKSIYCLK